MYENQDSTSCVAGNENECKCVKRDSVQNIGSIEQNKNISEGKEDIKENDKTLEKDISVVESEAQDDKIKQYNVEPPETDGKRDTAPETEEKKSEEEDRELAQAQPRRVVKKGRSLIPRKETKEVPQNFVDVPDYGYVGIDGSFQVPF